jgi:hypothetical protein
VTRTDLSFVAISGVVVALLAMPGMSFAQGRGQGTGNGNSGQQQDHGNSGSTQQENRGNQPLQTPAPTGTPQQTPTGATATPTTTGGQPSNGDEDGQRGNDAKVNICHATGSGRFVPITVSENAVPAHEAHGDIIGVDDADDCSEAGTTPTPSTGTPTATLTPCTPTVTGTPATATATSTPGTPTTTATPGTPTPTPGTPTATATPCDAVAGNSVGGAALVMGVSGTNGSDYGSILIAGLLIGGSTLVGRRFGRGDRTR